MKTNIPDEVSKQAAFKCSVCNAMGVPISLDGLCQKCSKKGKEIAKENEERTLKVKKLGVICKERELEKRAIAGIKLYESYEKEGADIPPGVLEEDAMLTPHGAVKLGPIIPKWKLENMRDRLVMEIDFDKREIEEMEK